MTRAHDRAVRRLVTDLSPTELLIFARGAIHGQVGAAARGYDTLADLFGALGVGAAAQLRLLPQQVLAEIVAQLEDSLDSDLDDATVDAVFRRIVEHLGND